MSCVFGFSLTHSRVRGIAGKVFVCSALTMLAACSGGVSRFDYPMFANNSADNNLTTSSLSPVPAEPVYANGAPANGTAVVRQDLPPPNQQVAAANPQPVQPAPLPPRTYYEPQPQNRAPRPKPQANYQTPRPVQTQPVQVQPVQPVTPTPPAITTVRVQSGDTLYKLARTHGVSVDEIKSANNMRSTRLSIGQELVIPGAGAPPAATVARSYTVQRGDSIAKIARAHDVSIAELQQANGISRPNLIQPGQTLKIPGQAPAASSSIAQNNAPVRVASRGPAVPLPPVNPARGAPAAPAKPDLSSSRPQQKVAARTDALPKPEPMTGNQFRWPAKGRIISGFGEKPSGKHNDGINVAVPKGTEIKAAENGVVAYAGSELEPYGNLILIRHANNWVTAYAHNDELLVKRGDTVQRGQIIAKAGQSGNVSQPQLHFELRQGSKPVNPLSYMASNS